MSIRYKEGTPRNPYTGNEYLINPSTEKTLFLDKEQCKNITMDVNNLDNLKR